VCAGEFTGAEATFATLAERRVAITAADLWVSSNRCFPNLVEIALSSEVDQLRARLLGVSHPWSTQRFAKLTRASHEQAGDPDVAVLEGHALCHNASV
jgi:hypothetical protein